MIPCPVLYDAGIELGGLYLLGKYYINLATFPVPRFSFLMDLVMEDKKVKFMLSLLVHLGHFPHEELRFWKQLPWSFPPNNNFSFCDHSLVTFQVFHLQIS